MFYVLLLGGTIYNIPSFYEGPFELFFYGGVLTNYNNPTPPPTSTPLPPCLVVGVRQGMSYLSAAGHRVRQSMSYPSRQNDRWDSLCLSRIAY
jgi:hypothetical protein